MNEQFQRFALLLTSEQIEKINKAKVAVIGLGGVGSVATLALARNGVKNFVLCDFDEVQISNINRQLIANFCTIGMKKTDVCEKMIKEINPDANVIVITDRFSPETKLFDMDFDYLIDAIDDLDNKYLLIKMCLERKKTFISSMGTARKMDLTKLKIMDLNQTSYDPLARKLRKMLRDNGIYEKVPVVSSLEEPIKTVGLGSYMPVTSTAGLMLADYIIKKIIL